MAVLIAAWQRLKQACIVVDCGTAVTIDLIDDEGVHRGGVILPSDTLMRFSLNEGTAQLDYFDYTNQSPRVFATNTEDAIVSGCRLTLVASISKIVQEMRAQINRDIQVFATGGSAYLIENTSGHRERDIALIKHLTVIPTLNFEGMMALIEEHYE